MTEARVLKVGSRIRELRRQKGLSQEALASEANLDRSYMGRVERGENNITLINVFKISDALNVDPSLLFKGIEKVKY